MKKRMGLNDYAEELPESMPLKKKVIKVIMKSKEPLSQKEILDLLGSKDWTNLKRILRDILDEGLIVKKYIGTKEYYIKVEFHKQGSRFEDGNTIYFMDVFEPDYEAEGKYIRIKQAIKVDRDNYEVQGKITIRMSKLKEFITELALVKFPIPKELKEKKGV